MTLLINRRENEKIMHKNVSPGGNFGGYFFAFFDALGLFEVGMCVL